MPYRRFEPERPYRLSVVPTGELVTTLTGAQLDDLLDLLVKDHAEDRDYWIDHAVIDWLESQESDPELVAKLRMFVDRRGPVEMAWAPETSEE